MAELFFLGGSGGAATAVVDRILRMAIGGLRCCIFTSMGMLLCATANRRALAVEIIIFTDFGYRLLHATVPKSTPCTLALMSSGYLDAYV